MNIDKIERSINLPFPPERVWRSVTEPEELSRWFGDRAFLKPVVGGEMVLEWDEYGRATGRVEAFDPPRKFAYRWRAHGVEEEAPMTSENSTLVTFELFPTDKGTRLEVVETGFATLPEALRATAFRENESGWRVELQELVDYLVPAANE